MDTTTHGAISWSELTTTDADAALAFYTKLFRWKTEKATNVPEMDYNIVMAGDAPYGGVMKMNKPGCPVMWLSYVTVDNVDETAKLAEELGGKVCMPPMDVNEVGRIAILIDPQGALIGVITYLKRQP